jgi:O-antigen/teichoic acid export membrane protein
LKYTGLLGSVQFLNILISIVRNKAAAVLIGPVGMGLADLYFRAIELLGNSTNFGLGFSAVRRLAPLCEQGNLRALKLQSQIIRTMIFWAALLGAIVTIVLSPALSLWLFHDTSHALSICALAPAVAFSTLTSGEVAILRGTSRLKAIASTSALVAGCTLLFALVIYSIWGISGVIPVLLLTTLATFLLHLRVSTRQFPYHISPFRFRVLRSGRPLIQLGAAYVGAGILGSGTEMLIRATVVNSENGLYAAGLYAAGLTLTVSYARMIFVAMDADYFPRLSAAAQDISRQNLTVNSQIHVLSLLMAPFLIILAISLPLVVRLLYSAEYLPVMPMVWAALPFMYFKSIYSPIAYLSLAHGDSRVYFVMELLYDVVFAAAVVVGYQYYGLLGAGIGLSLANLADLLLLSLFYRKKYQFRFTRQGALLFLPQGILLLGVLCCMLLESVWLRYGISGALCCLSVLFSFIQLKKLWRSRPTA